MCRSQGAALGRDAPVCYCCWCCQLLADAMNDVACRATLSVCLLSLLLGSSSDGAASAFVLPASTSSRLRTRRAGHYSLIAAKLLQQRHQAGRHLRLLSHPSDGEAVVAAVEVPANADGELEAGLSGKAAVEQAAERLLPLFAEVDSHTQRWEVT